MPGASGSRDPILGFLSWNEEFVSHLLGVARIAQGRKLTITGLPKHGVHVALFANDSAPGFGASVDDRGCPGHGSRARMAE